MAEKIISAISAGKDLRECLVNADGIVGVATDVYPIIGVNCTLPYIAYRCKGMQETQTKDRFLGPSRANYEIVVYDDNYDRSIELAEAVRTAVLDLETDLISDVSLTNRYEGITEDCYYQAIEISLKTIHLNQSTIINQ